MVSDLKNQRWQFVYEHAPVALIEWDKDWCVRAWNSAAEQIFGWKAEEAIGKYVEFLLPENGKEYLLGLTQEIGNRTASKKVANKNLTKSGAIIDCEWYNTSLTDHKGQPVGAISVAHDVTAQLEARKRIISYSQHLSELSSKLLLLSQSDNGDAQNLEKTLLEIVKVASQGLHVARSSCWILSESGSQMKNIACYDQGSPAGTLMEQLSVSSFPLFFESLQKDRLIDAHYCRIDYRTREFTEKYFIPYGITSKLAIATRLRGKLHGMICFEHIGAPREWHASEQVFACAIADLITLAFESAERNKAEVEKRRLENQLFQSQKLEALGTLAGGIAHDFNNILAAILGSTELAIVRAHANQAPNEQLSIIHDSAHRARDLVQQILSFSKNQTIEYRALNLQEAVESSLKLIRISFPSNTELDLSLHAPYGFVFSNQLQIHQILLNLYTNAIHACRDSGGAIRIALSKIDYPIQASSFLPHAKLEPGSYLVLSVSDSGIGIDPDTVKFIFDPFFTTKDPGSGSGLGLSIVHNIMSQHKGAITVESLPGAGTKFSLFFPHVSPENVHP